jgi:hypothetical protein
VAILELDQLITPDSRTYTFRDDQRRFTMSTSGEGLPPIEYITQRGPFQHGETVVDYRLRPRVLQMVYREKFCSREAYWDGRGGATMTTPGGTRKQIAGLLDAIRPNRQATVGAVAPFTLRKLLPGGQKRDLAVFIQQGPAFEPRSLDAWDEWAYQEVLRFVAHDPVWTDPTANSTVYTQVLTVSGLFFPAVVPLLFGGGAYVGTTNITYLGTWLAYPTITIQGPCADVIVENLTTAEKLHLTYPLVAGDVVTINLAYGQKTVIKQPGAVNLVGYLSTDSNLATFHLEPHPAAPLGVNDMQVTVVGTVGDTAYAAIAWYTKFIGL